MKGTTVSLHSDYLRFWNDPAGFAQRRGIRDRTLVRYLLARHEALKIMIRERANIAREARQILREWKVETGSESLSDVAYTLRVPGREEPLADPRRLSVWIKTLARPEGAIQRTFEDALMIQELLILLGRDPIEEFARFHPLIQDWATSGPDRPPPLTLAHFLSPEDMKRLGREPRGRRERPLVRKAVQIVQRQWHPRLEGLEQRTRAIIAKIGRPEHLRALAERLRVCRLCNTVFIRPRDKQAQQYCATCRRRWPSDMARWYRAGGKEKLRQWRAEKRRQGDETTRPR